MNADALTIKELRRDIAMMTADAEKAHVAHEEHVARLTAAHEAEMVSLAAARDAVEKESEGWEKKVEELTDYVGDLEEKLDLAMRVLDDVGVSERDLDLVSNMLCPAKVLLEWRGEG